MGEGLTSDLALLPVIRMAGSMSDRCHNDAVATDEIGEAVGKSGEIDTSMSAGSLIPEQRLPEDGGAKAFDFSSETNAQTLQTFLAIPRGFLGVGKSLWKKLQNSPVHCPGAILRKRAKTSDASTVWDSPASKRAMRFAISASQAACAGFGIRLNADKEPVGEGDPLIGGKHKSVVRQGIKCCWHEETLYRMR